jgi:hypothetical protein
MTIRHRIARLEHRLGRRDQPCPDHRITFDMSDGDPEPDESEVPPCPNCGRPGIVQIIVEEVVDAPTWEDSQ